MDKWRKIFFNRPLLHFKNQIFETDIIESKIENDHFTIVYQSSLKLEWKQQITEYLMRDKKR